MTEVRVCSENELEDGQAVAVAPDATGWSDAIAVFRDGDAYYALDDTCPHEEASLAEGWVEDGEVECPLHQSRFDLGTGKVTCLPATRDACTHAVAVRDGAVWLSPGVPAAS